jgi:adenylate cyclase
MQTGISGARHTPAQLFKIGCCTARAYLLPCHVHPMNKATNHKRYTLHFSIFMVICSAILLSSGLATFVSYLGQKRSVSLLVTDSLTRYKDHVVLKMLTYVEEASATIRFCGEAMETDMIQRGSPANAIRYFKRSLDDHDQFSAFSFRRQSGEILMVKRMPDNTKSTAMTIQTGDSVITGWTHENQSWTSTLPETVSQPLTASPVYSLAAWYSNVVDRNTLTWSDIHQFSADGRPSITCALPVHSTNGSLQGVISIDIALTGLTDFMRKTAVPGSTALIAAENSDIVALVSPEQSSCSNLTSTSLLNLNSIADANIREAMRVLDSTVRNSLRKNPSVDTEQLTYSFEFTHAGRCYLSTFSRFPAGSPWKWTIGVIVPQDLFLGDVRRLSAITFSTCGILILISLCFGYLVSRHISRPLSELSRQMARVRNFELIMPDPVQSRILEVDTMTRSFEGMIAGLRSFEKYVPAEIVRQLVLLGSEARVGGEKRCLTIYFSDIADFTSISESMPPEVIVNHLCKYLSAMSDTVRKYNGTLDKYIGDAIMAFWGAPGINKQHAFDACKTALENNRKLQQMVQADGSPASYAFNTRIGINTGEVVVANIGSEHRMNYTVIGDHVNVASRLEGLNKIYGTRILISESTFLLVQDLVETRALDVVAVKGRSTPLKIYELLCLRGDLAPELAVARDVYEAGLDAYLKADFTAAVELFTRTVKLAPCDKAAEILLNRSRSLLVDPPSSAWTGIFVHKTK